MEKLACSYCQKEYQKSLNVKRRSPIVGYLCSNCQKMNACGNPFCQNKNPHEH